MVQSHSPDEIRRTALAIYNARERTVLDYAANPDFMREGRTPAEAMGEDLLNPAVNGLDMAQWNDDDLRQLRQALIELAQADMEAT